MTGAPLDTSRQAVPTARGGEHDHSTRHHDQRRRVRPHHDTVQQAAQKMKDLGVGALPICGEDNRLKGMITDRDIVLTCVAGGHDVTA